MNGSNVVASEYSNRLCDIVEWGRYGGLSNHIIGSLNELPDNASGLTLDFLSTYKIASKERYNPSEETKYPFEMIDE